jgi:hypothetical protein
MHSDKLRVFSNIVCTRLHVYAYPFCSAGNVNIFVLVVLCRAFPCWSLRMMMGVLGGSRQWGSLWNWLLARRGQSISGYDTLCSECCLGDTMVDIINSIFGFELFG